MQCATHPGVGTQDSTARWRLEPSEGGVRITGRLRTKDGAAFVAAVRSATRDAGEVVVDLGALEEIDGGVIALLRADFKARRVHARLLCGDRFRPLLELYRDPRPARSQVRCPEPVLCHVGRAVVEDTGELRDALGFVGEMTVAGRRFLRRPRLGNWGEIPPLIERAGADALPIVVVLNFLLGFVMAYMSAHELASFGANVYVADLVAIAMTRQLGPLMTAILVSGRSGASFATELGSMRIAHELDALRTLGLEPYNWLVTPRVLSLVLVVPLLTIVADVVGMLGGLLVAVTSLDVTARQYIAEIRATLGFWDVTSGLIMSVAFGLVIGLIACREGFAASGGPQGVGRRTTATVVSSLFMIVLLDAAFTILFRVFGVS